MAYTAKITSKGQVTIPKAIRETLKGDVVEFRVAKDQIILKAVRSVGGALRAYAKEPKPFSEIREKVREEVIDEKKQKADSLTPTQFFGISCEIRKSSIPRQQHFSRTSLPEKKRR